MFDEKVKKLTRKGMQWVQENAIGAQECSCCTSDAMRAPGYDRGTIMLWAHLNAMGARECIRHEKAIGV